MLSLVKGSDYDSREDCSREDYNTYEQMNEIVRKAGFDLSRYRFDSHGLDPRLADRIRNTVINRINPSTLELDKYFHSGEYARTLRPKTL